jgi:hypothetical protein
MVERICNELLDIAPETYNCQSTYGRRIDAEYLLKLIEGLGMSPPMYKQMVDGYSTGVSFIYNDPYDPSKSAIENVVGYYIPIRGWEPENEEE